MGLTHYSHYRNSDAAAKMYEIVSPALFEVYLKLPDVISSTYDSELMFQHVRSISGLDGVTPNVGTVVQKYKFAERHYAAAGPDKTSLELTIIFTLNLNDAHENYVYNTLRRWYDLIYNPQNGKTLTKKSYANGSWMDIYEHDREGSVWRQIRCLNIFPSTPPTGLNENNYDSVGDAKTLSMTFIVDDWVEKAIGMQEFRDLSGGIKADGYTLINSKIPTNDNKQGNIYDENHPQNQ